MEKYSIMNRKYGLHKAVGAYYLALFGRLLYLLVSNPLESYSTSYYWHYPCLLHAVGLMQSLTALISFNFLPRQQKQEGFFGDKTTVSKAFVTENAYFVLLCIFASLYVAPRGREMVKSLLIVEPLMIFFPFQTVRKFFPKTSFERNDTTKSTRNNSIFFQISKYIASYFYLFGKHYVGNMLNYCLFLNQDTPKFRGLFYWILLGGGYNLTIGIFLHTLKFRKILGPKTAIGAYLLGYTISGLPTLLIMTNVQPFVWFIATGGLIANLAFSSRVAAFYQCLVALLLYHIRSSSSSSFVSSEQFTKAPDSPVSSLLSFQ